jgi:hypothetical protein
MKATIENKELVIRIPLQAPVASNSGKSMIVASTGGFATTDAVEPGTKKTISISVNAIIKAG